MSFFTELKRRNVIRVALAYAVLSWLLLQVGYVLFEALRLDDSALTIMLAILALGFIPAVIFAWIYELTPEGVKRESEIDRDRSITHQTGHKLNITIVMLLTASLALFMWDRFSGSDNAVSPAATTAVAAGERSIAVLPFADMSAEGDQAYFGDGIAEELLNVLAQVEGLKVAARTSSFKFRGDEHDIGEIGNALNVATVLEGSVRKVGDQVRITAQLIDVAAGYHLWSETYDRKLDNILSVQDDIAESIADALKLELQLHSDGVGSRADIGEAYDLYLRGRELAREPSKAGLLRALQYYEQALAIDPNFAPAHGAVASAWIWLEDYGGIQGQEAFDKAEPAARRALELDPTRADALTAMGFVEDRQYTNPVAAKDYFERALVANPAHTEAATLYADALVDLGELEKALEIRRQAVERDPLSGFLKSRLASLLARMGYIDEAERLLDEIFAANPEDTYGFEELANLRYNQGRLAEAIKAYEILHANRPGDPYAAANIAACYALMMDFDKARSWVDKARAQGAGNRWELEARYSIAYWQGDWDALFRAGQLHLAPDGAAWQGEASLGQSDWEAARASFRRTLSRLDYRQGDAANGATLESLVGLALAEKQLGLESWTEYAATTRSYTEKTLEHSVTLGSWPAISTHYMLARIAAVEGDLERVISHFEGARAHDDLIHQFFASDPYFAALRDEPRLVAIATKTRERMLAERRKLEPVGAPN
jgi:TolB-like protein/regulator of sirC expression with transglutaminase-like and TPR domain